MKKLVAYYSRPGENYFGGRYQVVTVGNTEKVARMIANEVSADLYRIEQAIPYSEKYQECIDQAKRDLKAHSRPAVSNLPSNIDEYDEVYLGYPIYWGNMPMAVYTFLENYNWNGKKIRPFCTHEGSGIGSTPQRISSTCKGAEVTTGLAIVGSDADRAGSAVKNWV